MHRNRGAVFGRAGNGDFKFARQIGELGMEGTPLAQYLGVRARINNFIARYTGKLVAGDIAYAIA